MPRRDQDFQSIRSEGGLLPPDLLRRLIDPRSNLGGTKPSDYGLPVGERINEVITQSWNRLIRHWTDFKAAVAQLPEGEAGTGLTNDKWSLPLLRELGFGFLPSSAGPEINGRGYAIARFFGPVPVHLIGCGLSLDRRATGQRGAAAGNPHGLVQEFLNRSPDHLWGIVSNGLRLRVLRDNQALSRQSFIEFDLEAMLGGEVYADFVLLWLVVHATRFAPREGSRPESSWLEQWAKEAEEQGTRALADLRGGVERALQVLGEGFTGHPQNISLREALRSGGLPPRELHGQLLRVVYRLIFLFVAEDRTLEGSPLLHPREDSETSRMARERYATHYSTGRLRDLAGSIKGSRHGDLWRQFQIFVTALSGASDGDQIRRHLALPILGSFLWDPASTASLNDAELSNFDLLEALRHLAFTRQGKVLRPVDYKNLGAEELGGVYESLLALTPQISADGARFTFAEFAGNERKTSGSYYTPDALVQCLLDSALDPIVEGAIKGKSSSEAEKAILALKICDPAVGSGHFLVGAAHRLARHLARVRALAQGESEPSPLLYQHALRNVIGRCLYGVDINPMAAELCRVGLWLEALEPGKPLSFLDHHIRVGNSLIGATPQLIASGVPDLAFTAIEGDDKKACSTLKKRNKSERKGSGPLFAHQDAETLARLQQTAAALEDLPDDRPEDVRAKELAFRLHEQTQEYGHKKKLADTWCSAFVFKKYLREPGSESSAVGITQAHLNEVASGRRLTADLASEVESLAGQFQFFHWHLAFPEVFGGGGFDCVLGNPPWERPKPEPAKYFAATHPEIANAQTSAIRDRILRELEDKQPDEFERWKQHQRFILGLVEFITNCGGYLLSATGKFNLGNTFVELSRRLLAHTGRTGLLNVSGLATDDSGSAFISDLMRTRTLVSFFDFENRQGLFPEVDSRYRFSAITISGAAINATAADFVFYAQSVEDLRDTNRHIKYSLKDIELLNPLSGNCPVFRENAEAELVKLAYRRARLRSPPAKVLWDWDAEPTFLFVMSDHSDLFSTREDLGFAEAQPLLPTALLKGDRWLPLYEAKMFHHFDHRWASLKTDGSQHDFSLIEKNQPSHFAAPRYWMKERETAIKINELPNHSWVLAVREVTNSTNERTAIAAVLPMYPVGHNAQVFKFQPSAVDACSFLANLNALILDFAARTKVGGSHLSSFILRQLPILSQKSMLDCPRWDTSTGSVREWMLARVLELTFTAWDLEPFAADCGWRGPPFRWDEDRRFLLRCELDAAFFHLYLASDDNGDWCARNDEAGEDLSRLQSDFPITRDAVAYVCDSFSILRRKDEEKYSGDYRTKRTILEIYDAMQGAIRTGRPYQSSLKPPPGPPIDTNGKFVDYAAIAASPQPHIHLPRDQSGASAELHLSDLVRSFPHEPFILRLGTKSSDSRIRVVPALAMDLEDGDMVVLAAPALRLRGEAVPAAVGKLAITFRSDASNDERYVLISVRGHGGVAQARFSETEWRHLKSVGRVEELN